MARSFPTVRGAPKSSYDAVVIGAGIGGLTCAALLARRGLRVLVAEQHYMVGGYCSTFTRCGFTFDAATHFYPLLGNVDTITGRLLCDLGVATRWIKMDPVDHFHLPDGSRFDVPADYASYRERLSAMFPHEAAALEAFFALVRRAYTAGLLYHFRGRRTAGLDGLTDLTVRNVLDQYFADRRLKLLLTADCPHWGSPPGRTSFVFDSMLRLAYFLGNYFPEGGSQAFADGLAERITAAGGEILMGTPVDRIVTRGGMTDGVELLAPPARSRRRVFVRTPVVVSNADLIQTLERLLRRSYPIVPLLSQVKRLRPSYPCFLMHVGLKGVASDLLRAIQGYYWDDWNADRVGCGALRFKLFVPTLFDPQLAPQGGHVLIVQRVQALEFASVTDWAAHKREVEQFVLEHLRRLIPGFDAAVIVRLSATARTHQRYTLNHQGAMLGWEMSPDQLADHRVSSLPPVGGLFFVGHWTRPGGGITPVMISAADVASRILGEAHEPAGPSVCSAGAALQAVGP
jgi:phytoene dehydrogenase-like protein